MSETVTIFDKDEQQPQKEKANKKKASTFESVLIIAMLFVIAVVVGTFTDRANREFYAKEQNDLWGFVDVNGKEAIPFIYEEIDGTSLIGTKDIVVAKKDGKWGAVNFKNEAVIDFIYDDAIAVTFTENSVARVFFKKDGKWGVVDNKNKTVAEFIYEEPFEGSETEKLPFDRFGVVCMKKQGKYGLINLYAKEVIPFIYDEYFHFVYDESENERFEQQNGYAVVCKNGKWGTINLKNETLIDFGFDYYFNFAYENSSGEKVAIACKDGKCGAIDFEGNTVVDFKYDVCCCYMEYYPVITREYCSCECSFGDDKKSCIELVQEELKSKGYVKAD